MKNKLKYFFFALVFAEAQAREGGLGSLETAAYFNTNKISEEMRRLQSTVCLEKETDFYLSSRSNDGIQAGAGVQSVNSLGAWWSK